VLGVPGALINLTGYTAKIQLRRALESSVELELTHASGITLGGVAGTITIVFTSTQTSALLGDYVWDLKLTDSLGHPTIIPLGIIHFDSPVTR
jgi:hypothetical protein